ncbi:hypothetical protein PBY51_017957 [Eleginops maclovinus]|uniref:Uncharacterized protein n=1 Tax=Eleginops maclovinus TaxID=56733 RepID=A0AAN7XK25_ELEMC|nr:hypothetical protein PBY51_017957 [Eleginops maclovinus]
MKASYGYILNVRPAVPSELRTEEGSAAIGTYFRLLADDVSSHRLLPSCQPEVTAAGKTLANDISTNSAASLLFRFLFGYLQNLTAGKKETAAASVFSRFLVEVVGRDSGTID